MDLTPLAVPTVTVIASGYDRDIRLALGLDADRSAAMQHSIDLVLDDVPAHDATAHSRR